MSISEDLKAEAYSLGFCLFGISLVAPPAHLAVYENWLAAGQHAGMRYLEKDRARQKRAHPELILPDGRFFLSLAIRYPAPEANPPGNSGNPSGRVAAYAWGEDYHQVVLLRLEQLMLRLQHMLGHPFLWRSYTDTGPILERDFAQSSGLGWIGKNTCLINPSHGSYFFLAEVFLAIELQPDPPFGDDRCGTCQRCIQACPTQCILPNRTIDSSRCISYLTIENKGAIPIGLRSSLGNWVFGCDICQIACPWNSRFTQTGYELLFLQRPGIAYPYLKQDLHLTPQQFNQKFHNSPIQRARRRGYLRNVAVALGNSGDLAAVEDLALALEHEPEPLVRSHIAWALGRIAGQAAHTALEKALKKEPDTSVLQEIHLAIEQNPISGRKNH